MDARNTLRESFFYKVLQPFAALESSVQRKENCLFRQKNEYRYSLICQSDILFPDDESELNHL